MVNLADNADFVSRSIRALNAASVQGDEAVFDAVLASLVASRPSLGSDSSPDVIADLRRVTGDLHAALERELATDAALASNLSQFRALWALREDISESQGAEGKTIKHDIALPISRIASFVAEGAALLASEFPGVRLVAFGHLGDGNLHYNISPPEGSKGDDAFLALEALINQRIHDLVARDGGSISAEHGLGVLRRDEASRYRGSVEDRLMRAVKSALDPLGLMNPGKLLP